MFKHLYIHMTQPVFSHCFNVMCVKKPTRVTSLKDKPCLNNYASIYTYFDTKIRSLRYDIIV